MRLGIAAAALTLAALAPGQGGAQVDPWGQPIDPFSGAPLTVDPYEPAPIDPSQAPLDPYQPAPLDPLPEQAPPDGFEQPQDAPQGLPGGFEAPEGTQLAPFSQGVPPAAAPAPPPRVENPIAVFSGLDKITGRITSFDVHVDETRQFGALQVTPRACYTAPPEETPKTDTFVEIDEVTLDRDIRRIFTGWMFADSPGLNALEHPVYDVWLRECRSEAEEADESASGG